MEPYWTAIFCTVHLCVGFVSGRFFRTPPAVPQGFYPGFAPAVARFEQAYRNAEPTLVRLPEDFQQALECLKQSVHSLAEKVNATPALPSRTTDSSRTASGPCPGASPDEPENSVSAVVGSELRHGHAVPEFMALWDGDVPSVHAFERVQCHDLSASGISFFFDRRLDVGEQLVITLGQQKGGVLMAAEVVYARAIIVRGEDLYRTGCKFVRRLDPGEVAMLDPLLTTVRSVYSVTR